MNTATNAAAVTANLLHLVLTLTLRLILFSAESISSFAFIPKIQAAFSGKKEEKKDTTDKVVEQIIKKEEIAYSEDLSDDAELVAVIAAAIAAYEGSDSASGYVVRSLKRRK